MRKLNLVVTRTFLVLACLGLSALVGQAQQPQVSDASCDGLDLEQEHYLVRSSAIVDPFKFLPWVGARQRRAATRIAALINGKPFLYSDVRNAALKIIEEENFLPDASEPRVKLRLEFVSLKNCSNKAVDVVYSVYSSQIMPTLSGAPENRARERTNPEETARPCKRRRT